MAYDESLAARVRALLERQPGTSERKMFGGLAFLLRGNMACGIVKDELMVRVGPDAHDAAVRLPHAREMDFAGRPMRGMLFVAPPALTGEDGLREWVQRALSFTSTLPAKAEGKKAARATPQAKAAKPAAQHKPAPKRPAPKRKASPAAPAAVRAKPKARATAKARPKRKLQGRSAARPLAKAGTPARATAARRRAGARAR